ncbi:MAG: peptidoglycan DD-metalloendopeptidase family protein [Oscillospiraceae bacterium]|nr:peptidoglycan DD-metalloendopeptidase family protein [Oscillospiraceae bacterium]
MNKSLKAKLLAFSIIGLISINSCIHNNTKDTDYIKATQTIEELETLKVENNKKIEQLQEEIKKSQAEYDSILKDENAKLEYQNALNEKIELQNQNINYVVGQINQLDEDIEENRNRILVIESDIVIKNAEIERSMELFKQRLRASYMSGNDNLAAVLTGSADFYDLLAKMELVSKVAQRDDEIVNTLRTQLEELDELNQTLIAKQNELDISMADAEAKKEEFDVVLQQLSIDYQDTLRELEVLNSDKNEIIVDIEAKEKAIAQKEEEREVILADLAAAQEALRIEQSKKAEESKRLEESKRIEESKRVEESRRAEESRKAEESKLAAQQSQQPSVTSAPAVTAPPATTAATQPPVTTTQAPSVSDGYAWPVPGFYSLSSNYGYRSFDNSFHKGIDIAGGGIAGTAIVAADDGVVARVVNSCTHNYSKYSSCGCGGGYGNYVSIVHSDGTYSTMYAHCKSVCVSAGQSVTKGQTIGYVGTTGYSTGNHLHFEVIKNGSTVDPMNFY